MARLIRGLDDEVWIEFGGLGVFFEGAAEAIGVDCDGEDDLVQVRLEAWDGEPPAPGEPWEPVEDTTAEGGDGFVSVGSVAEEATQSLIIGPPHFLYGVTVHTITATEPADLTSEETWENRQLSRWLMRFWPIRDVFDPVRHARPDRAGAWPEPAAVAEPPVSDAADWPQARTDPRQEGLERWLARQGLTLADHLTGHGLDPDLPFDRIRAALAEHELPVVAARRHWPDWWVDLVRSHPEMGDEPFVPSEKDEEWNPDNRAASARALVLRRRIEEVLNPDRANVFTAEVPSYEPRPGHTYRGWRWDYADRPAEQTFTVDRRVVFHDVMSDKVLVTGIVTVLGMDRGELQVRDALPVEAARLRCAEATWGADLP
ncbi:hypothetical protein [Spongiactinospora sp. TRM90649]|uniref:hypothetical protein n=1 Tax=Spongiactinospora sp. TRM90649 TaxID=3031114 RepID=UPI0023F885CF|nr:hypothetical protein [Spongiactinospora sp. TRM90649]MDF5754354.1 hypothetical protein [Spongiactinospora sp. TRM90649]